MANVINQIGTPSTLENLFSSFPEKMKMNPELTVSFTKNGKLLVGKIVRIINKFRKEKENGVRVNQFDYHFLPNVNFCTLADLNGYAVLNRFEIVQQIELK